VPSPEEERLKGLVFLDKLLKFIFFIVLVVVIVFSIKWLMAAVVVVKKAGVQDKNILQMADAVGLEIYNHIGPLTGKYIIQAGFWSLIVLILPAIRFIWKVEIPVYGYWIAAIVAFLLIPGLPVDKIYGALAGAGRVKNLISLCLVFMFVSPFVVSRFLSRQPVTRRIARHLTFSILFGLLNLQIFLEG
jgi:hypothetical protein